MLSRYILLIAVFVNCALISHGFAETKLVRPKVNHRVEPVGIENDTPVFRWNLEDDVRGTTQKKYRICVGSEPTRLTENPVLWDSGWVESSDCVEIPYQGEPLESSRKYFWSVQVLNNRDEISELARPATFVTGILNPSDWKANWITMNRTDQEPLPIFRKSFSVDKKVKNAFIHICGLGHYELRLNGNKVGQSFIDPGWTNYRKTCLTSSYDVTEALQNGENVFGVMLGNGMYNVSGGRYVKFTGSFGLPKLIAQMELTYDDGSRDTVITDGSWKCDFGPIMFSCVYGGEDFDATRLQTGWDKPGFDDTAWMPAICVDGPGGVLRAQEAPPIIVAETLEPTTLQRLENGQYIADFGYNFSGRPRIKVRGLAGSQVTVKTGELVDRIWEGHSYTYTLKGSGDGLPLENANDLADTEMELILPKFSYFGFQFLRIEGAVTEKDRKPEDADKPTLVAVYADFTTSASERVGTFRCSNERVNAIDAMIERSVRSNLQSVLTDCPHREKLGWLEVAHLMGPSIMSRFDVQNLYRKICRDMTESQLENGLVPDIAPEYVRFEAGFFESPEWGSASVQLPYQLFQVYGDTQIVPQQMETMEHYVDYLASTRNEQGLVKAGLGDWYDWSPEKGHAGYSQHTPGELTATAMLYDNARTLHCMLYFTEMAANQVNQANHKNGKYRDLADQVAEDYIKAYVKEDGMVATGSQAAYAMTIANGLYDWGDEEKTWNIWQRFLESVEKAGNRPRTGEVAFRYLLKELPDNLAWEIVTGTEKPGYGYMLEHCNMQTLSETWDGPGSSMNHCMFGHAQEWFMTNIAGINLELPSHKTAIFHPTPLGDLTFAEGIWICPYGKIVSSWKIEGDRLKYHVEIPIGFEEAVIQLPMFENVDELLQEYGKSRPYPQPEDWSHVTLDGKPIRESSDVASADGNLFIVVLEITNPSGPYDFEVPYHVRRE